MSSSRRVIAWGVGRLLVGAPVAALFIALMATILQAALLSWPWVVIALLAVAGGYGLLLARVFMPYLVWVDCFEKHIRGD
jgi:hypothetical protein